MTGTRFEDDGTAPIVAIIGGGVTGAAIAYHLAAAPGGTAASVIVFEPRERLGAGLAYDTVDPVHRINVPAAKMSLLPDDETHFARWLAAGDHADPGALRADGAVFARRALFGRYIHAQLEPFLADGRVQHRRDRIAAAERVEGGWRLTSTDGAVTLADTLVIATSHPPPAAPGALARVLAGHPGFVPDATRPDALAGIRSTDRVLVVGTGLTAADVIAALDDRGHRGPILALSRRGQRSRGHAPVPVEPFGDFVADPAVRATDLVRRVRTTIATAAAAGVSWHAVFDQLRLQGSQIWAALPVSERRRLLRHIRPWFDVHRFRIAPQVEAVIDRTLAEGRLELLAARVTDVAVDGAAIRITLRRRGAAQGEQRLVDAVVVTTGPAHSGILDTQPYLAGLAAAGHVALDPVGLGLATTDRGRAIGADGPIPSLFVAGPLARGTFGELMGLPQVTDYAAFIAGEIRAAIKAARLPRPAAPPCAHSGAVLAAAVPAPPSA